MTRCFNSFKTPPSYCLNKLKVTNIVASLQNQTACYVGLNVLVHQRNQVNQRQRASLWGYVYIVSVAKYGNKDIHQR